MKVSPMRLGNLTKLCHAKPGNLIELYDSQLQPAGYYIVMADPAGSEKFKLFNPDSGEVVVAPYGRCKIYKGAQIVLDFIEGAM